MRKEQKEFKPTEFKAANLYIQRLNRRNALTIEQRLELMHQESKYQDNTRILEKYMSSLESRDLSENKSAIVNMKNRINSERQAKERQKRIGIR